jgi:hypothetical protein
MVLSLFTFDPKENGVLSPRTPVTVTTPPAEIVMRSRPAPIGIGGSPGVATGGRMTALYVAARAAEAAGARKWRPLKGVLWPFAASVPVTVAPPSAMLQLSVRVGSAPRLTTKVAEPAPDSVETICPVKESAVIAPPWKS